MSANQFFGKRGVFDKYYDLFSYQYDIHDVSIEGWNKRNVNNDIKSSRRMFTHDDLGKNKVMKQGKWHDVKSLKWIVSLGKEIQWMCGLKKEFDEVHFLDQSSQSCTFAWHTDSVNDTRILYTDEYFKRKTVSILLYAEGQEQSHFLNDFYTPITDVSGFNGMQVYNQSPQIYTHIGHAMLFSSAMVHRSISFMSYTKNPIKEPTQRKRLIKASFFFQE